MMRPRSRARFIGLAIAGAATEAGITTRRSWSSNRQPRVGHRLDEADDSRASGICLARRAIRPGPARQFASTPRSLQLRLPKLPPHVAPHVQIPRRNPRNRPLAQRTQPHSQRRRALTLYSGPPDGDHTHPQQSFTRTTDSSIDTAAITRATRLGQLAPALARTGTAASAASTDVDAARIILSRRLLCASRLAIVAAGYRIVMLRNHRVSIRTGGRLH
jgi:hypothetical protein